jgi:Calcineurin-like phosphoesterase
VPEVAVTTLVIADLHLGDALGRDVLRTHEATLRTLLERLRAVDRLVLLGDVIELRHGPVRTSLDAAEPVLRACAQALHGRSVVLVLGNHDHAVGAGWRERTRLDGGQPAGLDDVVPSGSSPLRDHVGAWFDGCDFEVRYPGVWLDDGVYATHGHLMDVHLATPTLERLVSAALGRLLPPLPHPATVDDYEARLAPMLTLYTEAAQWLRDGRGGLPGIEGAIFGALARLQMPLTRWGLTTDVSRVAQCRDGLAALHAMLDRLAVAAHHVVFGHVHCSGPWPSDPSSEWTAGGRMAWNPGGWVHDETMVDPEDPQCPWRPGAAVVIDGGEPRLERILERV